MKKFALIICASALGLRSAQAATILTESYSMAQTALIPDASASGVLQSINVASSALASITSMTVTLTTTGGWNGDLYAYLWHDGVITTLINRVGVTASTPDGNGTSGMSLTFSDAAVTDVHTVTGALNGTYQADGRTADPASVLDTSARLSALSLFNSTTPTGVWRLFIADVAGGDEATLMNWGFSLTGIAAPTNLVVNGVLTTVVEANCYIGNSTIFNGGTLLLNGTGNHLPDNGVVIIGSASNNSSGTFDLNGRTETIGGLASAGISANNSLVLSSNAALTVDQATDTIFNGIISGNGSITKAGLGSLTLSGPSTYTGATNLTGGTLLLGANDVLPNTAALNLSSGTLNTGGFSDTTGVVSLTGNVIIDLGAGASHLTFNDVGTWTGMLTVWNWTGTPWTVGGTDQLNFLAHAGNINLANVTIYSDDGHTLAGTGAAALVGTELVAVPEPGAAVGGLVLLGLIGLRERRQRTRSRA
jgi:autotransporter-associated beta strand protein